MNPHSLKLKRLGIDTHQEAVVYMRDDCPVCRSEGFEAHSRVQVLTSHHQIIATLNIVHDGILDPQEAGLSEAAWKLLSPLEGETATFAHPPPVQSMGHVRAKLYGHRLSGEAMQSIIQDVVEGKYTDIQLSSLISACVGDRLDGQEIIGLTRAMIQVGEKICWQQPLIVDKHCVGGLPGNRTTPIVVAIVAAAGLVMPKTSSRAITSPAGTADTMATLTNVDLDLATMKRVVEKEGACLAWGGAIHLSPADDILIRIERALEVDSEGQLVASILSKKAAAGSTHVLIDMPVGPTAKVRSPEMAEALKRHLEQTGKAIGLEIYVMLTDGTQPIGRGIGPTLEANDVLAVLQGEKEAPQDLREKSLSLAAKMIELAGLAKEKESQTLARSILEDGRAWKKFQAICEAQGGLHFSQKAAFTQVVLAPQKGIVQVIDNRKLAKVAKLAGAPESSAAGLVLHAPLQKRLEKNEPLFTIHAETHGEMAYALSYVADQKDIITIGQM
ncbi:MAG: thymidine phosphorylase family protein [Deltaproteobacteria bacterium]|nr:thymidine phosphorylase family protein [Deltaproteobacteria bacterium]